MYSAPSSDQNFSEPLTRWLMRLISDSTWLVVIGKPSRRYWSYFICPLWFCRKVNASLITTCGLVSLSPWLGCPTSCCRCRRSSITSLTCPCHTHSIHRLYTCHPCSFVLPAIAAAYTYDNAWMKSRIGTNVLKCLRHTPHTALEPSPRNARLGAAKNPSDHAAAASIGPKHRHRRRVATTLRALTLGGSQLGSSPLPAGPFASWASSAAKASSPAADSSPSAAPGSSGLPALPRALAFSSPASLSTFFCSTKCLGSSGQGSSLPCGLDMCSSRPTLPSRQCLLLEPGSLTGASSSSAASSGSGGTCSAPPAEAARGWGVLGVLSPEWLRAAAAWPWLG